MGWTFTNQSRSDLIRELSDSNRFSNWTIIKSTVIGNRHWFLCHHFENDEYMIGLDLLSKGRHEYGFKTISEDMQPFYYDCPMSYFEYPTTNASAIEWRNTCKTKREQNKKQKKTYKPGIQLTLGTGWVYTLLYPAGKRLGWIVKRSDNTEWRMPFSRLNKSTIV